ncbi:hypothetical protein CLV28_0715 [Sediminihabitans luteus]|uniref:Phage tail tape measure protein domain-containing protein n=1 Tax=Sediminihabitans luteus TaxID=1138585 RepID=A0A2M9CZY0_9CELL|nr:phage tail tape measure protein [Sediminihabitans luteus]PJJ77496.1 hypothetical protein CLV28_0715 [Sediminihabitans luteus]GII98393.1 hypothetical protein Slu03_07710 [Sediminihabitans luteus]
MSGLDLGTLRGHIAIDGAREAEQGIGSVQDAMRALGRTPAPEVQVTADVAQAQQRLAATSADVRGLNGLDAEVAVTADTSQADRALDGMADTAGDAGAGAGAAAGDNLVAGMSDKLGALSSKAGPIVGSVIGAVAVIASLHPGVKIMEGIVADMSRARAGMFSARTGLDTGTARKFGAAAGEAYAQNFGESVDGNLDAARAALQSGLIGGDATQAEITTVINQLSTVADIIGADVPELSRAAGQAIKTGLAENTEDALGLVTKAYQGGLDVSGDLLEVISEYGTQFRKIGLDGPTAFGLVSQAVQAGARDTDIAADAIKEFSIRSIDGSKTTVEAYEAIGLNAAKMQEQIAGGGEPAQEALQQVFDGIAAIEDPALKAQVATGLFGTQAEDLGAALDSMDLSKARAEFGDTAGVVATAMVQINDNAGAKVEAAKRSIESAATGVQTALAEAFSPQLGELADWISTHRGAITEFVLSFGEGIITAARGAAQFASSSLQAFAPVLSGFGDLTDAAFGFADGLLLAAQLAAAATGQHGLAGSLGEARTSLGETREAAVGFFDGAAAGAEAAADTIENTVIPGIDAMHTEFQDVADSAQAQADLSDAVTGTATALEDLGTRADGTKVSMAGMKGEVDTTTESGKLFDQQARAISSSLQDQAQSAWDLGENQKDLRGRVQTVRDAFIEQAQELGYTKAEAKKLADQYGLIPDKVTTKITANSREARREGESVTDYLNRLKASISVVADTTSAQWAVNEFINTKRRIVVGIGSTTAMADGGVLAFADGGEHHVAQIAPAGAMRLWAEPETGGEAYIPLAESKRSRSLGILEDVATRFGKVVVPSGQSAPAASTTVSQTSRTFAPVIHNYERPLTAADVVHAGRYAELLDVY